MTQTHSINLEFQIEQQFRKFENNMLESIIKLNQSKSNYLINQNKSAVLRQVRNSQKIFQLEALQLIQHEMKANNAIILYNLVQEKCKFYRREAFFAIIRFSKNKQNTEIEIKKNRISYFLVILKKFLSRKNKAFIKKSFVSIDKMGKLFKNTYLFQKTILKCLIDSAFSKLKQNCGLNSSKSLIQLDISKIEPNDSSELQNSFAELYHEDEVKSMDGFLGEQSEKEKIRRLKSQIIQIQCQIEQYQFIKQEQMAQLTNKIVKHRLKSKDKEINELEKNHDNSEFGKDDKDIIVAKLIKSNFQLQEKLQAIYDLLSMIEACNKTQIGRKIISISKRKHFNIDLQKSEYYY